MSTISNAIPNSQIEQGEWKASANPWAIAVSVMIATFMVVLDSSVANVALPHIAGNLSASTDESTWVLTSYLVSNAIIVFTGASLLCGISISLPMLILARILQGFGGGGMQPLAQSILLESFPRRLHGTAMAVYGAGIVVAPVIGPTLGGWITDSYSWRWIFYINLPVGFLALYMVNRFIEDPPYIRKAFRGTIDYFGFGLMAVWLGTLQLVLDKGQEADWFGATWIRWIAAASVIAFVGFVIREFTDRDPIVQLRVLGNRNFLIGTVLTGVYGFVLYGSTALLPLFLQTLMGYPAMDSGLAVSPRGIGALLSMLAAGVLVRYFDERLLLAIGFAILGFSTLLLSRINLDVSMVSIIVPNLLFGCSGGLIFVPLTTLAMGMLRKEEIGNASGIYNLMRNIGGSIGIASVTTLLVRNSQKHQSYLAGNLTAGNHSVAETLHALQTQLSLAGADSSTACQKALGELYGSMQRQASLLAYTDNFRLLGYLSLLCIPLALLFHRLRQHSRHNL